MAVKRFKLHCKYKDGSGEPWSESYEKDVENPEQWGKETIDRFNATLRPHEKARELIRVEIEDGLFASKEHNWSKTNLFTLSHAGRTYDTAKCETCGITSKRFGLGLHRPDHQYRAVVYQRCDTAVEHLKKIKAKANA